MPASIIQEIQTFTNASVSSLGLAFGSAVTAGNAVAAGGTDGGASGVTHSWADNNSGSYSAAARVYDATNNTGLSVAGANNHAAGATTVTMTLSAASAFVGVWIAEAGGVSTTALDGKNAAVALTVSATNANQPALVWGICMDGTGAGTPVPSGGLAGGINGWVFGTNLGASGNKRVTTAASQSATFTTNGTLTGILIFDEAGGGGASYVPDLVNWRAQVNTLLVN
jgi:hypothetical protein